MYNLGVLYRDQEIFDEAEEIWFACLEGQKRTLGDDHAETLTTMNNLRLLEAVLVNPY